MPRINSAFRNLLVAVLLPMLLAAGCACNAAAPPRNLESTLNTVLTAWAKGDRSLAGHAAKGAKIDFSRVVGKPSLMYSDTCKLRSNGRGICDALYNTPGGGYSDILVLRYDKASSGKVIIDSAVWGGNAG